MASARRGLPWSRPLRGELKQSAVAKYGVAQEDVCRRLPPWGGGGSVSNDLALELTSTARAYGARAALRLGEDAVSYAELDDAVARLQAGCTSWAWDQATGLA